MCREDLVKDSVGYKLEAPLKHFGFEADVRKGYHDAYEDCQLAAKIYMKLSEPMKSSAAKSDNGFGFVAAGSEDSE